MQKSLKMFTIVAIGIATVIGVTYAATDAYFIATGSLPNDDQANTEMTRYKIHFTSSADTIDMADGNDTIDAGLGNDTIQMNDGNDYIRTGNGDDQFHMGAGNDLIGLGPGSDYIRFYGGYNGASIETIGFNDVDDVQAPTTYIKYTSSSDTIEIKSNSGDVIITLGQ